MIELWTDGSAGPTNPGPGGWAVVNLLGPVAYGHDALTTNIRMEGQALLEAFRVLGGERAVIYTDSLLWVNTITKWAPRWAENGWIKSNGSPVKNRDLVERILVWHQRAGRPSLVWVRGHDGNRGNELADEWASKARLERLGQPVTKRNPF